MNLYTDNNQSLEYPNNLSMHYSEWQVGLGAYYQLHFDKGLLSSLVPYIGIKVGEALLNMNISVIFPEIGTSTGSVTLLNLTSKRKIGFAFGLTALVCNHLILTAKGRFGDEKALFINGQLRY